jgi:hypothetical protein
LYSFINKNFSNGKILSSTEIPPINSNLNFQMLSQSIALDIENLYPDMENEEYDSDSIHYLNNEKEALAQANNFQDLISKKDEKYGVSISSRPKTFDVGIFGRHSTMQNSIPGAPGLDGENGMNGKNGNHGTEGFLF